MKARLKWCIELRPERPYPRGEKFSTLARFECQEAGSWEKEGWSLVVKAQGPVLPDATQLVDVRFLMDDAPQAWLFPGSKFDLREGYLVLAEGVIE